VDKIVTMRKIGKSNKSFLIEVEVLNLLGLACPDAVGNAEVGSFVEAAV
jgi:hypothetical protein